MAAGNQSLSLFGDDASEDAGAGKVHRELSKLMREIAAARAAILHNASILDALRQQYQKEVVPLEDQIVAIRRETFRILAGHLKAGRMKKRDANLLLKALEYLADELEGEYGIDMSDDLASFLGVETLSEEEARQIFGEAPPSSGQAAEAMDAEFEAFLHEMGDAADEDESGFTDRRPHSKRRGRKPDPKSKAAQKKVAEEQALAGDIRALYLLLARALHPDKEPDPDRRVEKTGWMQKVTDAYGSRDLARLLDILSQNPLEAVGPYLSTAPLNTVKGFTKRLRRELAALKREAAEVLGSGLPDFVREFITPGGINQAALRRHAGELKKQIRFLKKRNQAYGNKETVLEMIREIRHRDPTFFM